MRDNASPGSADTIRHHAKMLHIWIATTILIMLVISTWELYEEHREMKKLALTNAQNLTRTLDVNISSLIGMIDVVVAACSDEFERQIATGQIDETSMNQFLLRQQKRLPNTPLLLIANEHGKILYGQNAALSTVNIADRKYFMFLRDHAGSSLYIGKPAMGHLSKKWAWPLIRRINKADGTFGGVILVSIEIKKLDDFFSTIELAPGGSIALHDAKMNLITHFPKQKSEKTGVGDQDISSKFAAALKKDTQAAQDTLSGHYISQGSGSGENNSLHAWRRNQQYGFFINVGMDYDGLLASWKKEVTLIGGLMLCFILASLLFLRLIQRAQQREVFDTLALQAAVATEKQLSSHIAEQKNTSLALQASQAELRTLNATLEARVAERTEALSQAKQVAEDAARAKSEFLSIMSHEIRTPLNAIIGLAFLALKNASDPKQATHLKKIHLSGEYLLEVINNILDYSKIEVGMLVIEAHDFELQQVPNTVRNLLEPKAQEKGLQYSLELGPDLPAMLCGDSFRLTQILLNFGSNAIKFSSTGSVLTRITQVAQSASDCELLIEVKDSGIGLSLQQQAQLFQPFQQADSSTTRQFGGTGLGLSICKQLAKLMDGEVGVSSNLGTGSTFWAKVRLAKSQKTGPMQAISEQELSRAAAKAIRNARILLAEDNEFNQEIAVELLESAGAIVTVANNGAEAVKMALAALAKHAVFDCILMDVQMPEMDGFQATALIRAEPAYARVPILALSANTQPKDRERGSAAGMNDFISKPTPPALLYAMLEKYLASRTL